MKFAQEKIVIGCGVWLILLPFTGFPLGWKRGLTVATGIIIVYIGALLYKKARVRSQKKYTETKTETFTETQ